VLLGLGGGGLIAVAQSAIADMVAPRERGRYQGYISATYAIASIAGPVVGGLLTQHFSWRWVFWINLPVGVIAFFMARRALADLPVPFIKRQIDYLGTFLLVAGLLPFLIGVARAGQGTPWLDATNISLFAVALVLLAAFCWQECRAPEPLIPLQLFRNATFTLCCVTTSVAFFQVIALSVLIPLRLQMGADASVARAAMLLVPFTLAIPVGTFSGGWLMVSTGRYKPMQVAGAAMMLVALLGLAFSDLRNDILNGVLLVLAGIGAGLQLPSSLVAVQNAVPARHIGVATAATIFFRSLAAAIGIAVLNAILLATIQENAPAAAASFSGGSIMSDLFSGAAGKLDAISRVQLADAAEIAFRKIFMLSAGIALVALMFALAVPNNRLEETVRE
jgi:MFS family permease